MRFFRHDRDDVADLVLRLALGSVFLWFGIDKWVHVDAWLGWIPTWLWPYLPMSLENFITVNGFIEFAIGIALISGVYVREAAAIAGLFLLAIALCFGANEVTIRDNGLMALCLALVIRENKRATKWRIPDQVVMWLVAGLVLFLFVFGVLYLRAG